MKSSRLAGLITLIMLLCTFGTLPLRNMVITGPLKPLTA